MKEKTKNNVSKKFNKKFFMILILKKQIFLQLNKMIVKSQIFWKFFLIFPIRKTKSQKF